MPLTWMPMPPRSFPVTLSPRFPTPSHRVRVGDREDRTLTPSGDPRRRDAGRDLGGSKGKSRLNPKAGHQPTILDCARACGQNCGDTQQNVRASAEREPTGAQRRRRILMSKVRTVGTDGRRGYLECLRGRNELIYQLLVLLGTLMIDTVLRPLIHPVKKTYLVR